MSSPHTTEPLETVLRSATKEVVLGHGRRFCIIGERINPTGRRIFQEQLRAGDMSAIERDVKAQVEGGADVLDVNMGVPLTDEPELLAKAIQLMQSLTDLPICIDSSVVEALEAGLSVYQGRALVNSITAEDDLRAGAAQGGLEQLAHALTRARFFLSRSLARLTVADASGA